MNPKNQQSTRNQVCVCVDDVSSTGYTGAFYHAYAKDGVAFTTSVELISRMNNFYDVLGYPQSDVALRSFFEEKQTDYAQLNTSRRELLAKEGVGSPQAQHGKIATFQVFVMYRTNATWQGELRWVEKDRTVYFRSALEFLKLIDDALERAVNKNI